MNAGAGEPAPRRGRLAALAPRSLERLLERLDSVRLRLAAIIGVAAIPLLLLSGTIAWQNYELARNQAEETAARRREAAVARHFAAIDALRQVLRALADTPELAGSNPAACAARLGELLRLGGGRYGDFQVFDAAGALRCVAPALPPGVNSLEVAKAAAPLLALARASPEGQALGPVRPAPFGAGLVLPAVQRAGAGFIAADLRLGWFADEAARTAPGGESVWLVDAAGRMAAVNQARPGSLPDDAVLARLLRGNGVLRAPDQHGKPFAYASAVLPAGFRLLVAYPAGADAALARRLLARRLLELAVLTGLGLAAVGIGTHAALIQPLRQLGGAVRQWRAGGVFDASAVRSPPREIAALAESFGTATRSLAEQGESLRAAAAQQELLIKEIHHRVKNNLQIVASLLNLQASRIRVPAARAEFASARDRVRALATLHRHLYSQGDLTRISMQPFLQELIGQLSDAMGGQKDGRVAVSVEAIPMELGADEGVPLALIVTEAVSNALKYAFPGGRRGHVAVRLTAAGASAVLTVADDGIGMPAGPSETETGARDGLGLQLIRGFAKQLRATLEISHETGTSYRVSFAVPEAVTVPAQSARATPG